MNRTTHRQAAIKNALAAGWTDSEVEALEARLDAGSYADATTYAIWTARDHIRGVYQVDQVWAETAVIAALRDAAAHDLSYDWVKLAVPAP
jgi:hypothetical protein